VIGLNSYSGEVEELSRQYGVDPRSCHSREEFDYRINQERRRQMLYIVDPAQLYNPECMANVTTAGGAPKKSPFLNPKLLLTRSL
jgi:hypothetical protein